MSDFMNRSTGFASLRLLLVGWFAVFSGLSLAGGSAVTVRDADLKSAPSHRGTTLVVLEMGESVEVGKRQGAWFHVQTSGGMEGWIRMLAVRYQSTAASGSLLGALSKASRTKTTVATGVRGLDKEMLADAKPDHVQLQKLLDFDFSQSDARQFAAQGGLRASGAEQ